MPNETLLAELIAQHRQEIETLKKAQVRERKLRDTLIELSFPDAKRGTNKVILKNSGLELKGVIKETYSIDESCLEDVVDIGNGDWYNYPKPKPVLVMKEYEKLSKEDKAKLAFCVTCKDAAPVLTYEGEVREPILKGIIAKGGLLYHNDNPIDGHKVMQLANYLGFPGGGELINFLEGLQ